MHLVQALVRFGETHIIQIRYDYSFFRNKNMIELLQSFDIGLQPYLRQRNFWHYIETGRILLKFSKRKSGQAKR